MRTSLWRALSHRNFRLFFSGQFLSLIGTWAQSTAMPLLVYRLTGDEFLLGLVGFTVSLPSLLLTPFAGVIVDRVNRHRLLVVTQSLAMIQAFGLAALIWLGDIQVWQLVLFNLTLNAINAFDMTARQTFLSDMLDDRQDLANAIALNSSMVQFARLFGPYIGAKLIKQAGAASCFFVNGLSFLAVIAALLTMRVRQPGKAAAHEPILQSLREGGRYVAGSPPIRTMLLLVAAIGLVGMPYSVLMPVFNDRALGGDEETFGHLLLSLGAGALVAGVFAAWRGIRGALRRVQFAPFGMGIFLFLFSLARTELAAVGALVGLGFCVMTLINSSNTLIQSIVDDDKRGRVLSFYTMAFLGSGPFGNLIAGTSARLLGLDHALQFAGIACGVLGALFLVSARTWKADVKTILRLLRRPQIDLASTPPVEEQAGESLTPVAGRSG